MKQDCHWLDPLWQLCCSRDWQRSETQLWWLGACHDQDRSDSQQLSWSKIVIGWNSLGALIHDQGRSDPSSWAGARLPLAGSLWELCFTTRIGQNPSSWAGTGLPLVGILWELFFTTRMYKSDPQQLSWSRIAIGWNSLGALFHGQDRSDPQQLSWSKIAIDWIYVEALFQDQGRSDPHEAAEVELDCHWLDLWVSFVAGLGLARFLAAALGRIAIGWIPRWVSLQDWGWSEPHQLRRSKTAIFGILVKAFLQYLDQQHLCWPGL